MRKYWTTEEDNLIRNKKLPNESWREFAEREMPHRTCEAVRLHSIKKLNINNNDYRPRSFFFNKDIWKEQTLESCYWAGFIAADGCLVNYGCGANGYSFKVDLQESDSDHLVKLSNFCEYTGNLQKSRKRAFNSTTQSLAINCGLEWVEDLYKNFSITPRKTYNLQPPNIEDPRLIEAFMIGFIDGDGTLSIRKDKFSLSCTTASKDFAVWFQNQIDIRIEDLSIRNRSRKLSISKCKKYFSPTVSGQAALALIDYFSKIDVPKLNRKWYAPKVTEAINVNKKLHPTKFITQCIIII